MSGDIEPRKQADVEPDVVVVETVPDSFEIDEQSKYRKIAKSIGVAATAGIVGVSAFLGIDHLSKSAEGYNADRADLTDVEALEDRGACADELELQARQLDFVAGQGEGARYDAARSRATRFANSAELADEHGISCTPADTSTESLTPDFDVTALEESNTCASELEAEAASINPEAGSNESYVQIYETQQHKLRLQAELAERHDISCTS